MYADRLTIEDVQRELGGVSRATVLRLMADGKLGYVQASPKIRLVLRHQIDAYIEACAVPGKHEQTFPPPSPPLSIASKRAERFGNEATATEPRRQ
jgi:hypothetical protein